MLSFKAMIPRTRVLLSSSSLKLTSSYIFKVTSSFSSVPAATTTFEEEMMKLSPSLRGFDTKLDFDISEEQIKSLHSGLRVIKTAAVRGIEFNQPSQGNYLSEELLAHLHKKLGLLQGNWTANAIFLTSKSIDLFSMGVHDEDSQKDGLPLFQKIQDIAEMIEYYPEKNLLALYGGYITGTPFGMFLSSTVRPPFLSLLCTSLL
jgi:hypothetical protein